MPCLCTVFSRLFCFVALCTTHLFPLLPFAPFIRKKATFTALIAFSSLFLFLTFVSYRMLIDCNDHFAQFMIGIADFFLLVL